MKTILLLALAALTLTAAACGARVETRINPTDGKALVRVPAGEFKMGTSEEQARELASSKGAIAAAFASEKPEATLSVGEFWIDRDLVTNADYKKFLDANPEHAAPAIDLPQLKGWSWDAAARAFPPGRENMPVVLVTWQDARAYCAWAGQRLPTEAEWEKAARGTDGRMYPWGNTWDASMTPFGAKGTTDAAPVGTFAASASPYGANDMVGNVWQWTSSLSMPYPYQAGDGREDPNAPGERVTRGGMFGFGAGVSRANVRSKFAPDDRAISIGFRCAK